MVAWRGKQEMRNAPKRQPTWELLWLPATFLAFLVSAVAVPRVRSPWTNALRVAIYGGAWLLIVVVADRFLRRLGHRQSMGPARAGSVRNQRLHWRWPAYFTVYIVAEELRPVLSLSRLRAMVIAGAGIVLVEGVLSLLWRRRETARRKEEVADLVQRF